MNRFMLCASVAALVLGGCNTDGRTGGPMIMTDAGPGGGGVDSGPGGGGGGTDSGTTTPPTGGAQPGSTCNCDSDCAAVGTHAGICVFGVCMTQPSGSCSAGGSTAECPTGSRCWGFSGSEAQVCWPDCASYSCAGTCDGDGSCVASDGMDCDASCGSICSGSSSGGGSGTGGGCPPNSHPEGDGCVCDTGYVVNADRTACVRECTTDPDCGGGGLVCIDNECRTPPCTEGSCGSGLICASTGDCVVDIGTPPPGPPPTCAAGVGDVPDWRCTSGCSDIVQWEPDVGPGWWDYPLNGESESDQYRSYIRRDVMMLVKYATAMVACQGAGWTFGNGGNLGLGDMSESDGSIPGTRDGSPGHPAGTHVNGHDMDIAYYQVGTSDNRLRAVCEHTSGGADQYHCTGEPTMLDPWRTALFIAHLHANPNLRVIGVDGRVGPIVDSAISQLCGGGWLSGSVCSSNKMTYETTDMGRGWFRFHHHHLHVSISG